MDKVIQTELGIRYKLQKKIGNVNSPIKYREDSVKFI